MEFHFFDDPEVARRRLSAGEVDAASGLSPAVTRDLARWTAATLLDYPGSTMTAVLLNLRPGHPEFADPAVRTALLEAIDRTAIISKDYATAATSASGPIPPSSSMFDPLADLPVAYDPAAATAALKKAGWTKAADGWHLPRAKAPLTIELVSPDKVSNAAAFEAARMVAHDWTALGLGVTHVPSPPGDLVTGRLATGKFQAAVGDVTVGLDPDLYPLLASSQTVTGGSNVIGLQDPALDKLLVAARGPGTDDGPRTPPIRPSRSSSRRVATCSRWPSRTSRSWSATTLTGPVVRQVADPADRFWDVLTWRLAAGR